ncbi:MAG TPA: PAS domain S-box protein [Polyangia bacterium]|nr:PAS domain S-box protein [Polyangia bacterium]
MSEPGERGAAWFGPESDEGLRDFMRVYDAQYDEILAETMRVVRGHAEFAPVLAAMTPQMLDDENRRSRERLRRAVAGDWAAYEVELRAQGAGYAHMGMSFSGWYDLVGALKRFLTPRLIAAMGSEPARLAGALSAMMTFVDRTMSVIGEEYLATKEIKLAAQRSRAERNEQRYRMLFDNSPAPMWVYDVETLRFLAVNRAAIDHYGYSEAEFLAMSIEDIRFPEDLGRLQREATRTKSADAPTDLGEWRHRKRDGSAITVELRLQNCELGGRRAHMIAATDVSERNRALGALAQSKERYRTLVAATSAVVWRAEADGSFIVPQPSWETYTGQPADAYAGEGWLDAIHEQDRERIRAAWAAARATRALFEAEGLLRHAPSGSYRYFLVRAVPLADGAGELREWIGTVTDIDERKRAELPGRFFALSLDLLCIAGPDGYFKRVNPAFRSLGYTEAELMAAPFISFVHPDDHPAARAAVEKLMRGEPLIAFECRFRCKDGSYRDTLWNDAADPSGFIYAAARDITERKRAERQLAELNRQLTERNEELTRASRAKTDFLAMMSHELRTPLNSIIGFSEVLIDGKFGVLNDKQARYLRNVHGSGRHLLGLINDLLDLSKVEAGRLDIVRQPCAPRLLAADAIVTLQPQAAARGVRVVLDAPADGSLPPISADGARFKQVLYNLLSNAIKFTAADGEVRVTCGVGPEPGFVRTSVSDNGGGISDEDVARLFTPFTQLANAAERGGTGLGLALTKQLVEVMGGRISVHSRVGEGSTFSVDLPVYDGVPQVQTPRVVPGGTAPLALVVDDDPAARELLGLALQGSGFRTLAASSGDEAIAQARRYHPDVITLDVFLPTIDGWDVLQLLKGDPQTAAIPVVMVSISSDRGRAFSLGAVEHLVKPVAREALLEALARRSFTTKVKSAPVHVLAIDDDVRQLDLFRAALEPQGFRVRVAASGRAGVEAARSGPVDLVLLDLVMPDISGVEVVAALRADERTRAVPILLVTAHELGADERARLNGDVVAVVSKGSMTMSELLKEIERVLRRRAS